ncbi:unnamed protein product [Arctogadus glacialis]
MADDDDAAAACTSCPSLNAVLEQRCALVLLLRSVGSPGKVFDGLSIGNGASTVVLTSDCRRDQPCKAESVDVRQSVTAGRSTYGFIKKKCFEDHAVFPKGNFF